MLLQPRLALLACCVSQLRQPYAARRCGAAHLTVVNDDTNYYDLRFDGVRRLYGDQALARLRHSRVLVVGLGGVGSWSVEALARSGVGSLVLIDLDEICISNTNRQLHALQATVGRSKARVLADRVGEINPECEVVVREEWLFADDAMRLISDELAIADARGHTLALLDAVDGYREKAAMVAAAHALNLHVVVAGAAGGKSDPTRVRIADLALVSDDPLLRSVRTQLRKRHGFPAGVSQLQSRRKGKKAAEWGVPCAYSPEPPATYAGGDIGSVCDQFGTACFATGAFGFAAAAHITAAIATGAAPPKRPRLATMSDSANEKEAVAEAAADAVAEAMPVRNAAAHAQTDAIEGDVDTGLAAAILDSHCHAVGEGGAPLDSRLGGGVCLISTGEPEWAAAAAAVAGGDQGDEVRGYYALGVHPWYVHNQLSGWSARLREALVSQPAAMVGEAGIDRFRLDTPLPDQMDAFTTQLRLAAELRRPLVVHCVRADGIFLDLLRSEAASLPPVIVMHAFGGSAETAAALLRLGDAAQTRFFFGFSARAARLRRAGVVMATLPADRLLLESDEHTAEGARVAVTEACALLADARGWTAAEAAERSAANARAAFEPAGWQ